MTTTISEQSALKGISVDSIRSRLITKKIEPIERKKWVLRGFIGQPYRLEDIENSLSDMKPRKVVVQFIQEPTKKHYAQKEICQVLRSHIKNHLNNKLVKDWSNQDWQEFENLKINLNK